MTTMKRGRPKVADTLTTNVIRQVHVRPAPIDVLTAEYAAGHRLRIRFSDASEREVDFAPFLTTSQHPAIRKYLELDCFHQFAVVDGNVVWNDYDLIFPVADLYKGSI